MERPAEALAHGHTTRSRDPGLGSRLHRRSLGKAWQSGVTAAPVSTLAFQSRHQSEELSSPPAPAVAARCYCHVHVQAQLLGRWTRSSKRKFARRPGPLFRPRPPVRQAQAQALARFGFCFVCGYFKLCSWEAEACHESPLPLCGLRSLPMQLELHARFWTDPIFQELSSQTASLRPRPGFMRESSGQTVAVCASS